MNEFAYPIGFKLTFEGHEAEIFSRYFSPDRSNYYVICSSEVTIMVSEDELTRIIEGDTMKIEEQTKEQTFSKEELISFAQYMLGCEGTFDVSFNRWLKQNNMKKSPEYQEYLRLKEKFGE